MDSPQPVHYSRREVFFFKNTLLCLVKALEKRCTTIDLKNEICVTGKIEEVDGYMNIVLSEAALYDSDGKYQYFPILHIQARNIRNIHIPDNVSINKAIKNQVTDSKKKEKKKITFKESRAKKQHLETLNLIKQMKEEAKTSEDKSSE